MIGRIVQSILRTAFLSSKSMFTSRRSLRLFMTADSWDPLGILEVVLVNVEGLDKRRDPKAQALVTSP